MNLYLITADTHGYDVYSSAVVAANSYNDARHTHPSRLYTGDWWDDEEPVESWALPPLVAVRKIGVAAPGVERGVICASFHAG
jgi:hypothetical protein